MVYLSQQALERMKNYKYVFSEMTPFCKLFNMCIWEPAATRLPKSLAPNTITIISSCVIVFTTFIMLLHTDLGLSVHPPLCYLLLAAAGYWTYNFLDVLDGKQARNLKVSSPLGQLLDHGLDGSVNTTSITIINMVMLGVTDTTQALMILASIQSVFLIAGWNEFHVGILRHQLFGLGVNEFTWANYTCLVLTVIKGYEIWDNVAFGLSYRTIWVYVVFTM